jgi:hypothetical protein
MKKEQVAVGSDLSRGTFECNECGKQTTTPSVSSLPSVPNAIVGVGT